MEENGAGIDFYFQRMSFLFDSASVYFLARQKYNGTKNGFGDVKILEKQKRFHWGGR